MNENIKMCCLCDQPLEVYKNDDGKVIYNNGNDALPLADGRCCNSCDTTVLLSRLSTLL